jgi:hypothetical protein|tara:strand:+ start:70 stop:414 length:345 start_codon:yes stop_codon:yes gene_type:complete
MHENVSNLDLLLLCEEKNATPHMKMDGTLVGCLSGECAEDLRHRIGDAVHTRDSSTTRSDERSYYNGILRVLRRRLREVEKHLSEEGVLQEAENKSSRRSIGESSRIMKLAGIL